MPKNYFMKTLPHEDVPSNATANMPMPGNYIPTLQDTVKKDTTLMMELLRKQAERLYPGVVESSDSLLLKNKVNGQNQTKESR